MRGLPFEAGSHVAVDGGWYTRADGSDCFCTNCELCDEVPTPAWEVLAYGSVPVHIGIVAEPGSALQLRYDHHNHDDVTGLQRCGGAAGYFAI